YTCPPATHPTSQHAMRADMYAVCQLHLAFEHTANVNKNITPADQFTALIKPRRIGQCDACLEQSTGLLLLPGPLELSLLDAAVDADWFPPFSRLGSTDG